jgi:hypothetical protein
LLSLSKCDVSPGNTFKLGCIEQHNTGKTCSLQLRGPLQKSQN